MKSSNPHIPFATLADLAENKLPAERTGLMAHVSACADCSAQFARLTEVIGLMREDRAPDAPRDVIAYAINIFQQRASETQPSLLRRLVAALSFDSFNAAPAFGMRSGPASARQLLYETDEADLDIRIERHAADLVVSGQVLGKACAGGLAVLQGPAGSTTAQLNDACEFNLSSVPPGRYSLLVRLNDVELEIPQLELGS